jgi:multiple sugar transport system permease protein
MAVETAPRATAAGALRGERAETRRTSRGEGWVPYGFLAPFALLFGVFVVLPAIIGIWMSLHEWDQFIDRHPWVGLDNYRDLFRSGSPTAGPFWQSMLATGEFTLFSVPLLVVLPLVLATLLDRRFRGRTAFRAIYFAPYVLGVAVVGILWRYLLDPSVGLVNAIAGKLGLPETTSWTTAMPWAWVSLVAITVWWTLGFNTVIYLAGLQDVDRELYDAAKVDGAGPWQRFRNVTLPGLRPVFLLVIVTTLLASANMFGQALMVTQGAPANETRTAVMYIAQEGFRNFRLGSAAAMSYVLSIFLMALSVIVFWLFRRKREDRA